MINRKKYARHSVYAVMLASFYLTGCSSSSDDPAVTPVPLPPPPAAAVSYQITVVNATNSQPLSPVAVIAHSDTFSAWDVGNAASTELEYIAEGGSNSQLLDSLTSVDASSASGVGPIGPGGNETITVTASATSQTLITVVTMLVNTNDAFSGLRSVDVSGLASGDSITKEAYVFDAGTELNSESSGTMPGPADGGEGFNAARTDINNIVRGHGGVVTADDGLSSSVLNQSHRFDNPGMMVTITRI